MEAAATVARKKERKRERIEAKGTVYRITVSSVLSDRDEYVTAL